MRSSSSSMAQHPLVHLVGVELLGAEVAEVLVHPVRGVGADDPVAPPRLRRDLPPPRQRRVPVVAQVVVVEHHPGRHGRQQPAHGRRRPRLVVQPGVLLEVLDLVDDLRIARPGWRRRSRSTISSDGSSAYTWSPSSSRMSGHVVVRRVRPSARPARPGRRRRAPSRCSSSNGADRRQLPNDRRYGASGSGVRMTLGGQVEPGDRPHRRGRRARPGTRSPRSAAGPRGGRARSGARAPTTSARCAGARRRRTSTSHARSVSTPDRRPALVDVPQQRPDEQVRTDLASVVSCPHDRTGNLAGWRRSPSHPDRRAVAANLHPRTPALVAQGIEHRPPEPCAQVRILPRARPEMEPDQRF